MSPKCLELLFQSLGCFKITEKQFLLASGSDEYVKE